MFKYMRYYANKTELSQQASMCQKWLKTHVQAFENSKIFRGDTPDPHYKGLRKLTSHNLIVIVID
jgi:hypothetical protein